MRPRQSQSAHRFFDAMNEKKRMLVLWQYILELLCLLHSDFDNKPFRHIVLQQLAKICQMEYEHLQSIMRTEIQVGMARKCFIRLNKVDENGNPQTVMKDKPDALATPGTILHCLLQLSQRETSFEAAIGLISIARLQINNRQSCKLTAGEDFIVGYMAHLTEFIQDLDVVCRMPSFSRTKQTQFVTATQQAQMKLLPAKSMLDIDKLWRNFERRPDSSRLRAAMTALDTCTRLYGTGTMAEVYKDVVDTCLQEICIARSTIHTAPQRRFQQQPQQPQGPPNTNKRAILPAKTATNDNPSLTMGKKNNNKKAMAKTDKKLKSPPPPPPAVAAGAAAAGLAVPGKIKVSASTAQVFTIMFDKSLAGSGLPWASFNSAMAELGFSIKPKKGSSVLFEPPVSLGLGRSVVFHQPHPKRLEGFRTMNMARRLTRYYGWDKHTFVCR